MRPEGLKIVVLGQVVEVVLVLILLSLQGLIGKQALGILLGSSVVVVTAAMGVAFVVTRHKWQPGPSKAAPRSRGRSSVAVSELVVGGVLVVLFLVTVALWLIQLPADRHALWLPVAVTLLGGAGVAFCVWLFRRSRRTA